MNDRWDSPEGYRHTVEALTVGRLREALAGLPDDMPVAASTPLSLAPRPTDPAGREDDDWVLSRISVPPPALGPVMLELDRPSGLYAHIHRVPEDEEQLT